MPVVETVAVEGRGIDELQRAIASARTGHADHELEADLVEMAARVGTRAEALLVLEGDEVVARAARARAGHGARRDLPASTRRG